MSEGNGETIVIQSSTEGNVHIAPEQVYNFPNGIVGFEHLQTFAVLPYEDTQLFILKALFEDLELLIIQALDTDLAIEFELDEQTVEQLEIAKAEEVTVFYIIRIIEGEIFVNQKAPIILSAISKKGCQFIIQNDAISLRVPLALKGGS